jgi:glyoxylase-like metal-dependent hydrolase (beta-lactamase superfamily II)
VGLIADDGAPAADDVEVSVFGHGYGECVVVHTGGGHWLVVDSCTLRESGRPVALAYLDAIGVAPSSIRWIVATHWHDDHVAGIGAMFQAANEAAFIASSALRGKEFLALVDLHANATGDARVGDEAVRMGLVDLALSPGERIFRLFEPVALRAS